MEKIEQIIVSRGSYVTEEGIMYNKKGIEICNYISSCGYYTSQIRMNNKKKNYHKHRVQAYQKYGDRLYEKGIVVRHLNGDKLDNSWENIAIGTQSDNMMDVPKQVRIKKAVHAASHNIKYNYKEVKEFHKISKSYKETMLKFNISSKGTLYHILNK